MRCPMYAEMAAYLGAKKRQEAEAARRRPQTTLFKPTVSKKKTTDYQEENYQEPWEKDQDNDVIEELVCPKCRKVGMQIKINGMDGSKFYGCRNFNTFMRCKGTYSWNVGQKQLRELGKTPGCSFRS